MKSDLIKRLKEVDTQNIQIPSTVPEISKKNFFHAINQLGIVRNYIERALTVCQTMGVPSPLEKELESILTTYLDNINHLEKTFQDRNPGNQQLQQTLSRLTTYYQSFFEISIGSKTMTTISAIICSSNSLSIHEEILKRTDLMSSQVQDRITKADTLIQALNKKASEEVVANYAKIFEEEEGINEKLSKKWFITSISVATAFLIFILASSYFDFLNVYHGTTNASLGTINYSNLTSKIIIVSVWLYFISFSFKQYSINKHLQTLNSHRKNALNSYKLFSGSIDTEDAASRNALMLQVAKAIYEYNTTGYLSNKQAEGSNSGLLEITKYISDNK